MISSTFGAARQLVLVFVVVLSGCNCGDEAGADAGPDASVTPRDSGSPRDAGAPDAGPIDGGSGDSGAADAGAGDSGVLDAGAADAGPLDAGRGDAGLPLIEPVDDGSVTLPHPFSSCAPGLGFASDGTAFLAHSGPSAAGVRVARLSGSTWTAVGGLINPIDQIPSVNICPALVVTAAGVPYVGFVTASTTTRQVRVMRFLNAAWEAAFFLELPIADFAPALALDLALDGDVPVLALVEFVATDHFVTVYRLGAAGTFVRTAPPGGSAGGVRVGVGAGSVVALVADRNNTLSLSKVVDGGWVNLPVLEGGVGGVLNVVADVSGDSTRIVAGWHVQGGARTGVHTAQSSGAGAAVELSSTADLGSYPSTVLRGAAELTQVHVDQSNPNQLSLRAFDGGTWSSGRALPLSATRGRLALFNGRLYLAYTDGATARLVRVNGP